MKIFNHGECCPICAGVGACDGLGKWEEIAACALSGLFTAVEMWRVTPANSQLRSGYLLGLTQLHNSLAEHAEALDPERFRITQDADGNPVDDGEEDGDGPEA
jgi:hypothetical protein